LRYIISFHPAISRPIANADKMPMTVINFCTAPRVGSLRRSSLKTMAKKKPKRRRAKNAVKGDQTYPGEHLDSGSLLVTALSVSKLDLPRSPGCLATGGDGAGVSALA
jgi:hypothetical protein